MLFRAPCARGPIVVDLTVVSVNDPPMARDDGPYGTDEDTPLDVDALSGLLGNDNDPVEGDPVTAVAASGTIERGGSYTVAVDGSFSYTPAADFFGVDTFTYQAFDGTDPSAPATVTINVAAVNDAPVARDDSASTNQGTPVLINAVGNDYDVDGPADIDPSTAVCVSNCGQVTNNGNGTFTYTPAAGQYGTDSFTYTVDDNSGATSNAATVTIVDQRAGDPGASRRPIPTRAAWVTRSSFLIYVWNDGPGTAYSVNLTDTLGSCFSYVGPGPGWLVGRHRGRWGGGPDGKRPDRPGDRLREHEYGPGLGGQCLARSSDTVSVDIIPMGGGGAPLMMLGVPLLEELPLETEAATPTPAGTETEPHSADRASTGTAHRDPDGARAQAPRCPAHRAACS